MNPILSAGLLIGVLCGLWTFVMGFTGWYKNPVMVNVFFAVVLIEIGGLIWGLRKTAAQGRTYSGQVVAGTLMGIIAGVIIFAFSMVFTTFAFPNYFDEINAMMREVMAKAGTSEAEITQAIDSAKAGQTSVGYAVQGFIGTFMTAVIASAIIALWIRARPVATERTDRTERTEGTV